MPFFIGGASLLAAITVGLIIGAYFAYKKAFFSDRTRVVDPLFGFDKEAYIPYRDGTKMLIDKLSAIPYERVEIKSRDGLRLVARYYHVEDGAPIEIQCHGFRSLSIRDFSGGAHACIAAGHNLLLIDQRAHGESEGEVISYGIRERYDVVDWIEYINRRFGKECEIVLVGISMGAATVLMASGLPLPENVRGIIADSPYSAAVDIIAKVAREMGIPIPFGRLFARLGARIFGEFNLDEATPISAVESANLPILLIHGDADSFVPCDMSREIYKHNEKNIQLEIFEGAEHAISYPVNPERYERLLSEFFSKVLRGEGKE